MRREHFVIFNNTLRKFCHLLPIFFILPNTWAQKQIKNPLHFVPADSVIFWMDDPTNLSGMAYQIDEQLHEYPLLPETMKRKDFKKALRQWNETINEWIGQGYSCTHWHPTVIEASNGIKKAGALFQQTADSRYMDAIERTIFNILLPKISQPGELTFERHIAAQALINTTGMMYATDSEGVYVNQFLNSTTHIVTDTHNLIIDQITSMPYEGYLKIRISGLKKGRTPITLRVRMPDWATLTPHAGSSYTFSSSTLPQPAIYINGRDEQLPIEQGYIVIRRNWNNGDEIYLNFPTDFFHIHFKHLPTSSLPCTAWQRGPLIYGYTAPLGENIPPENCNIEATREVNNHGHALYSIKYKKRNGTIASSYLQPIFDGVTTICNPNTPTN